MYNIIKSNYEIIFVISITCILVFLFMNSRKVIEGAKFKNQLKNVLSSSSKQVSKTIPALISKAIEKTTIDIKKTQTATKKQLKKVGQLTKNIDKKITSSNREINNITDRQKNILSNLNQQYNMHKTNLSTQTKNTIKTIKNMNKRVFKNSNEAVSAKNEAKKYAELSEKIYNDVFGASTAKVVKDNINELKQPFTTMQEGFDNLNSINPALFDLEKDLINKISDFNTTYYNYIRCSSGGSQAYCSTNVKTIQDVQSKSMLVNDAAKTLENAYNASPKNTDANFKNNHKIMMEKAKSIDELRRSLDTKMDAIIKSKTPPNELTQQYDSTVYTGIMWSVLATSVLFYVFTEM